MLEGFLSEYSSKVPKRKKSSSFYSYEPALQTGFSTIKTAKFDFGKEKPSNFQFNISKVMFFGERECLPGIKLDSFELTKLIIILFCHFLFKFGVI